MSPPAVTIPAVTKFTQFGMVSSYVTLWNICNPLHALLNIHNLSCTRLARPYGVVVVQSSLLAKWLRKWLGIGLGIGLGLGLGPGNAILLLFFFSLLQNVVNIFVFIGSVASYEYFNKMTYAVSNRVNLVRPMTIATCWLLNEVGVNIQLTL